MTDVQTAIDTIITQCENMPDVLDALDVIEKYIENIEKGMSFYIEAVSKNSAWGNDRYIQTLNGTNIEIKSLKKLQKLGKGVNTQLIIDFKDNVITIYNDYIE